MSRAELGSLTLLLVARELNIIITVIIIRSCMILGLTKTVVITMKGLWQEDARARPSS